jgi:hypothetical protein
MASLGRRGRADAQVDAQVAASDSQLDGHAEGCDLDRMSEHMSERAHVGVAPLATRRHAPSLVFLGNCAARS